MKKIITGLTVFVIVVFVAGAVCVNALNKDKINLLIYGVDGSKNTDEKERSDSIILVNYNFSENKIVATSIPRDSYVKITCKNNEYDKINHSYAYGGEKCLKETVSQLFELNNLKSILLDFEDVVEIVDYFGLIEVTPNYSFCQSDENLENKYCFEKDKKTLIDGKQALAYMRNRKSLPNGDLSRIENQRQILKILVNEFLKLSLIDKFQFYNYFKNNIKSDIKISDLNIKSIINVKQIELNEYTLKGENYINQYYYYKLNLSYLEKIKKYYI